MAKKAAKVENDAHALPVGLAGRYEVEKLLGEGGMGYVCLARDRTLPRHVAIKAIRPELSSDKSVRKRIEHECQYHAQIGAHPHIVTLFDKVEEDGQIYLIMEYVPGETLAETCKANWKKGEAFPAVDSILIVMQTLKALSHIHAHGIVHRDIKPDNLLVFLDQDGNCCAKLMDFGIARHEDQGKEKTMLTQAGTGGPGTPAYMAPEQIDSETFGAIGPAVDIYATGAMLYHVLSGKPPFVGTLTEVYTSHLTKQVEPLINLGLAVTDELNAIIKRAMEKQPDHRFRNPGEFLEALVGCLVTLQGEDPERTQPVDSEDTERTQLVGQEDTERTQRVRPTIPDEANDKTIAVPDAVAGTVDIQRTQVYTTGAATPGRGPRLAAAAGLGTLVVIGTLYVVWPERSITTPDPTSAVTTTGGVDKQQTSVSAPGNRVESPQQTVSAPASGTSFGQGRKVGSSALDLLNKGRAKKQIETSTATAVPASQSTNKPKAKSSKNVSTRTIQDRNKDGTGTNSTNSGWTVIRKENKRIGN